MGRNDAWQKWQREFVRMCGLEPAWVGEDGDDAKDNDSILAPEAKHGKYVVINTKLQAFMEQAIENAGEDKIPVLGLHPRGWPYDDSWVCMPAWAWRQLVERIVS